MAELVKTLGDVAVASISTIGGVAIASIKTIGDVDNTDAGGPSYLVNQNFETPTTGYDNGETWVEGGSGFTPNHTPAIVGSQSFRIAQSGAAGSSYIAFTATGKVHWYLRARFDVFPTGSNTFIQIRNSSGTALMSYIARASDGFISVSPAGGTANASNTTAMTTGVDYHFWGTYTPGTGANAEGEFGFSTDGTKPTFAASGNRVCKATNGTATTDAGRLYIGSTAGITQTIVFDKILVSSSDIGSNP